jgi:hypothetical protein
MAMLSPALVLLCTLVPLALGSTASKKDVPLYKQAGAPIGQRADDLLARMTTEVRTCL